MLPHGATPISFITEELLLSPSSSIRSSIGVPCGSLSLLGELRTFHVPLVRLDGLGPACSPVMVLSPMRETTYPHTHHIPFGSSLSAPLACFAFTTFNGSLHMLAIPSNPSAPTTLMLLFPHPHGVGTLHQSSSYRGIQHHFYPDQTSTQNTSRFVPLLAQARAFWDQQVQRTRNDHGRLCALHQEADQTPHAAFPTGQSNE